MSRTLCRIASAFARHASRPLLRASATIVMPRRSFSTREEHHGTTVLAVRKDKELVMVADGQVTTGDMIIKHDVKKLRQLAQGKVLIGFAGATADAFTLLELLETKIEETPGQLVRSCVAVAKKWRTDRYLARLEARLIACDAEHSLVVTGNGDVIEPRGGVCGVGSGSAYAVAAARALIDIPGLSAHTIAMKAMNIAADTCVYTNTNFSVLSIPCEPTDSSPNNESD